MANPIERSILSVTDPQESKPLPTPGVPAHLDLDAAIAHELDKVPDADQKSVALVLTGEKVQGGDARARMALVWKDDFGRWDLSTKTYVEVGQHIKPTVGVEVVLTR